MVVAIARGGLLHVVRFRRHFWRNAPPTKAWRRHEY